MKALFYFLQTSSSVDDPVSSSCNSSLYDSVPSTPTTKFFPMHNSRSSTPSSGHPPPSQPRARLPSLNRSCDSTDSSSNGGNDLAEAKSNYRIMFLGANKTGKTSIIRQFLYDKFSVNYKETVDDMYRGEFEIHSRTIGFDIQDVSGAYVYEFPGMLNVSLTSADAFVLVFSLDSNQSWEEVARMRDTIQAAKGTEVPIVVVGNKSDLESDPEIPHESLEATVIFDWENGYVESSAKERSNINKIFRELLQQAKSHHDFATATATGPLRRGSNAIIPQCPANAPQALLNAASKAAAAQKAGSNPECNNMRRRQSLPAVPAGLFDGDDDVITAATTTSNSRKLSERLRRGGRGEWGSLAGGTPPNSRSRKGSSSNNEHLHHQTMSPPATAACSAKSKSSRRSSLAVLRRDSCKIS